jgi:hypothetical protein
VFRVGHQCRRGLLSPGSHTGAEEAETFWEEAWQGLIPLTIITPTPFQLHQAARLKGRYLIAYADAFAAQLAQENHLPLASGDPELQADCLQPPLLRPYDLQIPQITLGSRCAINALLEENLKTFLGEMVVVGEYFCHTFASHHLHGDAIGQAVFFVRAGFVKGQGIEKRCARLWKDQPLLIIQGISDHARGRCSNMCSSGAAKGEKFRQYFIGSIETIVSQ